VGRSLSTESGTANNFALDRRICSGEGGKHGSSELLTARKLPFKLDEFDIVLRLGVAWIDENKGFLVCKFSRDGLETD
jgi:hypothetical protein